MINFESVAFSTFPSPLCHSVTAMWLDFLLLPATWMIPRAKPIEEYVNDMMAATVESHQIWWKSLIVESKISITPNMIMYGLLDMWHRFFPPLSWKQLDLLIALKKTRLLGFCLIIYIKRNFLRDTHIMLIDDAIVYPIVVPKRFKNCIKPQILNRNPPIITHNRTE